MTGDGAFIALLLGDLFLVNKLKRPFFISFSIDFWSDIFNSFSLDCSSLFTLLFNEREKVLIPFLFSTKSFCSYLVNESRLNIIFKKSSFFYSVIGVDFKNYTKAPLTWCKVVFLSEKVLISNSGSYSGLLSLKTLLKESCRDINEWSSVWTISIFWSLISAFLSASYLHFICNSLFSPVKYSISSIKVTVVLSWYSSFKSAAY